MQQTPLKINMPLGTIFRAPRMQDAELVAGLINTFSQRLQGINENTAAELENFWQTPGVSLADDIRLLLTTDGNPLGYIEAVARETPPTHPFIWMRPHPDYVDEVAASLFDWGVERCTQAIPRVQEDLRVAISTFTVGGYEPMQKLFESRGFKLIRHSFQMGISFDAPPAPVSRWPEGIRLKPLDVEKDLAGIYSAHDEAFSDHFGHTEQPFEEGLSLFHHWMVEDEGFDPGIWFVAMDGDEVAAYSICRVSKQEDPPIGWVTILGVRRPWRKRGLGRALLQHSFDEFYRRGLRKAGLGVDASNLTGALRLYERAGMRVVQRFDRYEKELRPGKELMTTELSE